MRFSILAAVLAFSVYGQAQSVTNKITCEFTEPFVTLEIDLHKNTITERTLGTSTLIIEENIRVREQQMLDYFVPVFKVTNQRGHTLLKLTMNMNGSDGMSNYVYPMSAEWQRSNGENLVGGCETNRIAKIEQVEDEEGR